MVFIHSLIELETSNHLEDHFFWELVPRISFHFLNFVVQIQWSVNGTINIRSFNPKFIRLSAETYARAGLGGYFHFELKFEHIFASSVSKEVNNQFQGSPLPTYGPQYILLVHGFKCYYFLHFFWWDLSSADCHVGRSFSKNGNILRVPNWGSIKVCTMCISMAIAFEQTIANTMNS